MAEPIDTVWKQNQDSAISARNAPALSWIHCEHLSAETMIAPALAATAERLRRLGPYAMIELLVPGGTVVALLLWFASGAARGHFGSRPRLTQPESSVSETALSQPDAVVVPTYVGSQG